MGDAAPAWYGPISIPAAFPPEVETVSCQNLTTSCYWNQEGVITPARTRGSVAASGPGAAQESGACADARRGLPVWLLAAPEQHQAPLSNKQASLAAPGEAVGSRVL